MEVEIGGSHGEEADLATKMFTQWEFHDITV